MQCLANICISSYSTLYCFCYPFYRVQVKIDFKNGQMTLAVDIRAVQNNSGMSDKALLLASDILVEACAM